MANEQTNELYNIISLFQATAVWSTLDVCICTYDWTWQNKWDFSYLLNIA